jgi:nucleoid-associated protein YgaU
LRAIFKIFLIIALHCLLFSACASRESLYRVESLSLVEKIGNSGAKELFPSEFSDMVLTLGTAEDLLAEGSIDLADQYYLFLIGKGAVLEQRYLDEIERRKEEALRQAEQRRLAELEIKQRIIREQEEREKEMARERAAVEEQMREAARAEAKRKADKLKVEREAQLVPRHTVKRGETLPQIAASPEVYGDSSLWPLLYKANRDQISDPGVLWPGQVLRIPRNYDKADINEARRFAAERPLR